MAEDKMGLLVLGKPRGESGESLEDEGAVSAAKAALKAIKAGDAEALSEALKLHYEHCKMAEESDEYEEEEA
jgi:DNA-binding GntR family transcriptional regulator